MKLFTRLIDSGVFVFWSSDGDGTSYALKVNIIASGQKVNILSYNPPQGQSFYTLANIGSGDYEFELNGYKDGRLYQTETKTVKYVASAQREEENLQRIEKYLGALYSSLSTIQSDVDMLETNIRSLKEEFTDAYSMAEFICKVRKNIQFL